MRYRSRPVEVEAMQWTGVGYRQAIDWKVRAGEIVAWVNDNGGEARYEPDPSAAYGEAIDTPLIAVRRVNGWAYAAPGHYIVKGDMEFKATPIRGATKRLLRHFYPVDPETFEQRWKPSE